MFGAVGAMQADIGKIVMSVMSTPENDALVSRIYESAMKAKSDGKQLSPEVQLVHDVEYLMQEVNSGASFEQYFRWASPAEVGRIEVQLESLGLDRALEVTRKAIAVAFPGGLPKTDADMEAATEWTEEQEEQLNALFGEFEDENGHITNVLGDYARRAGL